MDRRRSITLAFIVLVLAACICQMPTITPGPDGGRNPDPPVDFTVTSPPPETGGINGSEGGEISADCNGLTGSATFEKDSFSGAVDFKISCLDEDEIRELDLAVREWSKGTDVLLGAIKIEPSQAFNKDILLRIPLITPQPRLAGHYVKVYIYRPDQPDVSQTFEEFRQAQVDEEGRTASVRVDHFTIFALIESIPPTESPSPTLQPTATEYHYTCTDPLGCAVYKPGEPIRIAALLTFSNHAAYQERSKAALNGMSDAAKDTPSIAGHPIVIDPFDDQGEPLVSRDQMEKIVSDPQIAGVVGAIYVGRWTTLPKLESAGYTLISSGNTNPVLTQAGAGTPGFFRVSPSATAEAKGMAIFAYQYGYSQIGIAYQNSDTFNAMKDAFKAEFERQGGKVVATEEVSFYSPDYKDILYKISDQKADAIYFPLDATVGAEMASLAHDLFGSDIRLLGTTEMIYNNDFITKAKVGAIGMYYPDVTPSVVSQARDYGYDAMSILLRAISASYIIGPDGNLYIGREALRKSLADIYNFPGKTGTLTCNQYGDCANPTVVIYTYVKGAFQKINSYTPGN